MRAATRFLGAQLGSRGSSEDTPRGTGSRPETRESEQERRGFAQEIKSREEKRRSFQTGAGVPTAGPGLGGDVVPGAPAGPGRVGVGPAALPGTRRPWAGPGRRCSTEPSRAAPPASRCPPPPRPPRPPAAASWAARRGRPPPPAAAGRRPGPPPPGARALPPHPALPRPPALRPPRARPRQARRRRTPKPDRLRRPPRRRTSLPAGPAGG